MSRSLIIALRAWLALFIVSPPADAGQAAPTQPGEPCQVEARPTWSETERWVWSQICVGEIANLNAHFGRLDPRSPEDWTEEKRKLSSAFLSTILLHEPWRSAVPRQGVRIVGAWFEEKVNLEAAEISQKLWLNASRFVSDLDLRRMRAASLLSLKGSVVNGSLDLSRTKIAGLVDLRGAKVTGTLDMASAAIGQSLAMTSTAEQRAEFKDVKMTYTKVDGVVDLRGAKVTGTLNMAGAAIGESLAMTRTAEQRAEFKDVKMLSTKVGRNVELRGAKVGGTLNIESAAIGEHLLMERAELDEEVKLIFARVGGGLKLAGATLVGIDLTGARIERELNLGLPTWDDGALFRLRNATVATIQDQPKAWPAELDLDGFSYSRFGGIGADAEAAVAARGSAWFIEWLSRDKPYSPQPYEQLAKVLREMGHGEEANDVLFAGRERARKRAWKDHHYDSWLGHWLLQLTIGYGYGTAHFRSLYWAVGFVALGSVICVWSRYGPLWRWRAWTSAWRAGRRKWQFIFDTWLYSLDQLLPVIELSKHHDNIRLRVGARYYFYFHKVMGYVLASFLIAGLAGLTG